MAELQQACAALGLKKLFNSSGMDYRSLGMKDILPTLSEVDALRLLSENGNLVKRPLVITVDSALNGFKEEVWGVFFASR
ncbi:MAG: ArsC/Spx/MgsR family protein [Rubritalea sp.]